MLKYLFCITLIIYICITINQNIVLIKTAKMKTANDYGISPGRGGLKYYKYYSTGLASYKTKAKIVEALNLGIEVFRLDKIMNTVEKWNGINWIKI